MKEIIHAFTLFHKELNDKVKEEGRDKRALSKGVCTSIAGVILHGLTPLALEGSLSKEEEFLWLVLQPASFPMLLLDFMTELGVQCVLLFQSTWSYLCDTIP